MKTMPQNVYELVYMSLQLVVPVVAVFGLAMAVLWLTASNFDATEWTAGSGIAGALGPVLWASIRYKFVKIEFPWLERLKALTAEDSETYWLDTETWNLRIEGRAWTDLKEDHDGSDRID
jgi:hypothetical protein